MNPTTTTLSLTALLALAPFACSGPGDPAGEAGHAIQGTPPIFDDGGDDGDGGGDDDCTCEADLPYDVKLALGQAFQLTDAFLEKGPLPAAVLKVEMEAPTWRFAELAANTKFVVDQADCDHEGNRDVGRDRIFVTWQNADGSSETDHLDLRYCDDDGGGSSGGGDDEDECDCGGGETSGAGAAGSIE